MATQERVIQDLIDHIKNNEETLSALNHYMREELHLDSETRIEIITLVQHYDKKKGIDYDKIREVLTRKK